MKNSNTSMGPTVMIFTKFPAVGKVKTRLVEATNLEERDVTLIARAMLFDTIKLALKSQCENLIIAHHPKSKLESFKDLIELELDLKYACKGITIRYFAQKGDDFDQRFQSVVAQAVEENLTPLVILGADLPFLSPQLIDISIQLLADYEAEEKKIPLILGPGNGGGIYLVGVNRQFKPQGFTKYSLFRGGIELNQFSNLCTKKGIALHT